MVLVFGIVKPCFLLDLHQVVTDCEAMDPTDASSSMLGTKAFRKAMKALIWLCTIYVQCKQTSLVGLPVRNIRPVVLKVMSFNLRYDNNADKEQGLGWDKRLPAVVQQIMKHEPDIIGTQEGLQHQLHQLQQALMLQGMNYSSCGSPRDRFLGCFPCGEHCAIFSKLQAVLQSTFALSETPACIGSNSWGSACPRIATYAWFQLRPESTPDGFSSSPSVPCILFLNTHLDHVSSNARKLGSELIVRVLDELEKVPPPGCQHVATIITGDFNSHQRNSDGVPETPFATFKSFGFEDACSEFADSNCPFLTFHGYKPSVTLHAKCPMTRHGMIHGHIDWILWRGSLKLIDFEVDTSLFNGLPSSDHFPIIATFQVQKKVRSGSLWVGCLMGYHRLKGHVERTGKETRPTVIESLRFHFLWSVPAFEWWLMNRQKIQTAGRMSFMCPSGLGADL